MYYVDLKPKVTDVRIFTPEPACSSSGRGLHSPNGWGTILIGDFAWVGAVGLVAQVAPPMTVSIGGTNRTFYTAYFASILRILIRSLSSSGRSAMLAWGYRLAIPQSYE